MIIDIVIGVIGANVLFFGALALAYMIREAGGRHEQNNG